MFELVGEGIGKDSFYKGVGGYRGCDVILLDGIGVIEVFVVLFGVNLGGYGGDFEVEDYVINGVESGENCGVYLLVWYIKVDVEVNDCYVVFLILLGIYCKYFKCDICLWFVCVCVCFQLRFFFDV